MNKKGDMLYENVKTFETEWFASKVVPAIKALLHNGNLIKIALESQSAAQRRQAGEVFLRGIQDAWNNHRICMNMTVDILLYLENMWTPSMDKVPMWNITIGLFRDQVLKSTLTSDDSSSSATVSDILNDVVNDQIQMEREGDVIDRHLIRSNIHMLEGLWETDTDMKEANKLYLTMFEPEFLRRSRIYFQKECARLLRDADAGSWLRQTNKRLVAEQERCETTLSPLSRDKIAKVVIETMVAEHANDFMALESSGLRWMIDNDKDEDLRLLYSLVSMVDPKKKVLSEMVGIHVMEYGREIQKQVLAAVRAEASNVVVVAAAATGGSGGDKSDKTTPQTAAAIEWVQDVLALMAKFDRIWEQCFSRDVILNTAISKGYSGFIERYSRASEFVSLYVDDSLKRGIQGKTETEVDQLLASAITVIRHLPDKDLFERYYQKHLAHRLLYAKSESGDVEREMIARMKQEFGSQFTSKFEGMLKDMVTSEEVTAKYRKQTEHSDGKTIELSVSILTSNCWPQEIARSLDRSAIIYPPEIVQLQRSLAAFYLKERSGRKLQWVDVSGNADVKCTFPAIAGKSGQLAKTRRYEINVTTYGMVVLLLFNDTGDEFLSFDEVQQRTGIPQRELQKTLGSLSIPSKSRVLIKEPLSKSAQPGDKFRFNNEFISKSVKIRTATANTMSKVEDTAQRKETEDENTKTRAYIIDASIVRIMKWVLLLLYIFCLDNHIIARLSG